MIQKLKSMKANKKGFTLAELLIVVAIIAVLAAIAVPVFTSQLDAARNRVDLSNAGAASNLASSDYALNKSDSAKAGIIYSYGFNYDKKTGEMAIADGFPKEGAITDGGNIEAQGSKCNGKGDLIVQVKDGKIVSNNWLAALNP